MKILLVSLNFSPELTGIGKYSGEMADGLVARGHEVRVICAPPHYPQWRVADGYRAHSYRTERTKPGLTVHRCPVFIPARLGGLSRLLHLSSFALSSLPIMLWSVIWQPSMVMVVAPALFSAPGAWLTAWLAGAKSWLHVQDYEIDAAFELRLLRRPLLRRWATSAERALMRRFDVVSTISRRMLQQLLGKGVPQHRTELLPNWVDLTVLQPLDRHDERALRMRRLLAISPDQVACLYSGTINRKQGLGLIVEAARRLHDHPQIVFVICGNGELRADIEASAAGLRNMRFVDLQPASQFNALLAMADIHVLPQLRGAADLVMPSKLVAMLASGRPVVAAATTGCEVADVVAGCGSIFEPECVDGFCKAIVELACDEQRRARLGAESRARAERELHAQTVLDRLNLRIEDVANAPYGSAAAFEPEAPPAPRARNDAVPAARAAP